MCEREEPFSEGELRNNNQQGGMLADGDANANDIQTGDGGRTGDTGCLPGLITETAEQDKVIIWGTDSQCDDPDLAEFEMLEGQELEAYLVEEEEDFVGLAERNELQEQASTCRKATAEEPTDNKSREERKSVLNGASEQESSASHVSESREASRTELSSETDVFVSCLSTVSSMATALDTVGKAQTTDSWHVASGPHSTVSEDLTSQICTTISERGKASQRADDSSFLARKSTIPQKDVDMNLNSAVQSEDAASQGSFENTATPSSASLEGRKPWGSPSRPATPTSPKTTSSSPKRRPPGSPAKVQGTRALSLERSDSSQRGISQTVKLPAKMSFSSGIPKPVTPQQKEPEPRRSSPTQKPKNVRPKIITYVRKSTQAKPQVTDALNEGSTQASRLSSYSSPPALKDAKVAPQAKPAPVLCSSNVLFDKYRQDMQKSGYYPPGVAVTGIKPPSSTIPLRSGKSDSFHEAAEKYLQEHVSHEGGGVYRSPRTLRPQLGLGAVTRQPAAKSRVQQAGQRSGSSPFPAAKVSTPGQQDLTGELKRTGPETTPKSLLLRSGQSGLRPPGFSALPAARLASLGFVRSSSVSSVSSNQSNDSVHSDPGRGSQHPSSGSDDTPQHKATAPPREASPAQSRPQPPNAPSLQRRSLPPQHCSPLASRRDLQKDTEAELSPKSSPKRFAVVSPKPQSPVRGRTAAAVLGAVRTERAQELDRALIQQLRERCERQALQLQTLQAQLKRASLCTDVFSITTQHFCHKSESAIVKERELSLELARIRDEVAFSVAHWEQLQQEKEELERRFESELQGLRAQQQKELGALEERLKAQHTDETESLQGRQQAELEELRFNQQEQLEEMSQNHEASLMEMETAHNDTLATLQEEHARTVKNLKMAHEQQRKSLEEEFEKIRLSLQDQVDTLTFQNRSLRDRAKRFEEALRKSTDEQIVDALAPYKHIEEDLKSLKEVLEMKNQQIHEQELKISELEKIAAKNVFLEEKLQVLQQQNEDLKERIDKNLAVSRQLSEENANLQVHVEKESNEKKRLSRTNEELLWRLQTGELSPRMSPSSSPIHRPPSGQGSPARPHSYHQ
ncbi:microtubule-associated tumor suppressor candidate 2 [Archocentrus centrarchus]|uniref:microtubule-associated tumor suppressor candidate 2 n=1 Tax=Archocentrus centrarchus TaxID=63155 RepID=UPI0011EA1B8B|nr:microtubule-associated tumor suppressor candidate 2-like [Archocentrus centrarchus]